MPMAVNQIFVKFLDGRSHCLQISTPTISCSDLKHRVFLLSRIPAPLQRLVSGVREVHDDTVLSSNDGLFPSCSLLLRLPGGKGGFGSLLRGAATKAGQKKTNNFDACRDMSGRRLRHVNAEKKLEEWQAEAEQRRLEKLADQFLKKKAKEAVKKNGGGDVEKYLQKYREDADRCMEEVDESVKESFVLYKEAKRKILPAAGPDAKRLKIWMGKRKMDESDSDDDDEDDDDKSVILEVGNSEAMIKEDDSPTSVAGYAHSDGELSGSGLAQSNLEEHSGSSDKGLIAFVDSSESAEGNVDSDACVASEVVDGPNMCREMAVPEISPSKQLPAGQIKQAETEVAAEGSVGSNIEIGKCGTAVDRKVDSEVHHVGQLAQSNSISDFQEPFDLSKFNLSTELEVLGMERLKLELHSRGLKCGGTLQERAARLFLLKTTPLEKLPKKVLAKP